MTGENPDWLWFGFVQSSSVPNFDESVIAAAEQNLRRVVGERDSINVVLVGLKRNKRHHLHQ